MSRAASSAVGILIAASCAIAATQSYAPATGTIAVDRAQYMAKHQIALNGLVLDSSKALTVGNGRVGAMVWNARGLTMQVTGVDAAPQTALSAGRITFNTAPSLDANASRVRQILSLWDGSLVVRYGDGRSVTVTGVPNSEILAIHVEDDRTDVQGATLDVGMWDPATQMSTRIYGTGFNSMMGDVASVGTWKTVGVFAESGTAGLSRGQTDANNFGYTLAATVEGASFKTSKVDGRTVRLSIAPSRSYTIYVVCASRQGASGHNSEAASKLALEGVVATGYEANRQASLDWWHAFWERSFVQFSTTARDADYLENYYYLATYMIASGGFAKYPMHFINGVFRNNMDNDVHWSGAYWWWNMRNVYSGLAAANHVDALDPLLDMYHGDLPALVAGTKSLFGLDGVWIPETMGWDGNARHTNGSDYTKNVMTTAAEVALAMYDRFRYTGDSAYLRSKAYPMMKAAATFLAARLSYNSSKGEYGVASSHSHETYWNVTNAITDLAAIRSLFPKLLRASEALGMDDDLRAKWRDILAKLHPFQTENVNGQARWIPHDAPVSSTHNTENVTCELAWPYSVTGIGSPDLAVAVQSYKTRPFAYAEIWSPDAIQAARMGLGDQAFNDMKTMQTKYQDRFNGIPTNANGTFDFVGLVLPSINEAMLQSWNDTIRVFPAMPSASGLVGRFTLLAVGGFLVSSEKEAGDVKYVGIRSLRGGRAVVFNPWGSEPIQVRALPSSEIVGTGSGPSIAFATSANATYVLERTASPLSGFTFSKLTGEGNWSAKQLTHGGKTSALGDGTGIALSSDRSGKTLARPGVVSVRWRDGVLRVRGLDRGLILIRDIGGRTIGTFRIERGAVRVALPSGIYQAAFFEGREARFVVP